MWSLFAKSTLFPFIVSMMRGGVQGGAAIAGIGLMNYALVNTVMTVQGMDTSATGLVSDIAGAKAAADALPGGAIDGVTVSMCLDVANQFVPLMELSQLATAFLLSMTMVASLRAVREWSGVFKR